ncbi:MAG: cardiolipin synthase ClsB [Burkholderiaceae bacterium]|nr:MAG: cardiolipin synthase ClsB [Burkholderiaceae bacterium]
MELLKPQFLDGNAITLLHSGADFFPALEQAIRNARREIHLETYIFSDDATALRITLALTDAALRKVKVRVVVDGYGSGRLFERMRGLLEAAGVQVTIFRPEHRIFRFNRERLRRLHRKLVVVDQRIAFVGGLNIMDDRIDPKHGQLEAPRFDFAVRVEGPLVAPIHLAMRRLWLLLSWRRQRTRRAWRHFLSQWRERRSALASVLPGQQQAAFFLRDNLRFRHTVEQAYLDAIDGARDEIIIANAYFFPGRHFRRALYQAAARGVKITLLLQGRVEYWLAHYGAQALYDDLLRAGIRVIEYMPSFLHAKVAVIDSDWATIGSSNIDPFSLLLAREANVVVRAPDFCAELRQALLRAIESDGRPLVLHHHAQRPWWIRLLNWVAYGLLRIGVAITGQASRY